MVSDLHWWKMILELVWRTGYKGYKRDSREARWLIQPVTVHK